MGFFDKLFKKKNKKEDVEINRVYAGPERKDEASRRPAGIECVYASPEIMGRKTGMPYKNGSLENENMNDARPTPVSEDDFPPYAEATTVYASPEMMKSNYDSFNKDNYPFNYAAENDPDNSVMNEVYAGPVEDIEGDPFMKTVYDGPVIPEKNETCRFCPFCTAPIPLDAPFCPICGAKLKI